jgi:hypothetical protein
VRLLFGVVSDVMLMRWLSLAAGLAEHTNGSATFVNASSAVVQFWRSVALTLSPVSGCSPRTLNLNTASGNCLDGEQSPSVDCSTYYAEGVLALAALTKSTSLSQM